MKAFSDLSQSKQALLQERLRAAKAALSATAPKVQTIRRVTGDKPRPLSFMQQQLWFLQGLVPESAAYNVFEAVRIKGAGLSVAALERCFSAIIRRHEVLRTVFTEQNGAAVAIVSPPAPFRLVVEDLRHLPEHSRATEAQRLAAEEASRPFDLQREPMLRGRLLRLADDEQLLLVNMHHIASDGWSLGLLYKELSIFYQNECEQAVSAPELPIQFSDFAAWQRGTLDTKSTQKQLAYWKTKLAGAPDLVQIPCDHARPARPTFRGALEWFTVPQPTIERLKTLARSEGATLFMVLTAAFKTVLYRYTGQTDIVVGSTSAGRNYWETEPVIGPFINALPLRSDLGGDPSFCDLLKQVKATVLDAYANQDVPLELIVQELKSKRAVPHLPLFQTMLLMQSVPTHGFNVPGFVSQRTEVDNGTAKFDVTLSMTETADGLATVCEYSTDLFERPTIQRFIAHFQRLLGGIAENAQARLSELPLLTEQERQALLVDRNRTQCEFPDKTIPQLFEEQVGRTPDQIAVRAQGEQLTYRELDEQSTRLADFLCAHGVGPEMLVGVGMHRSVNLAVALFGVLKAGGAYVPLDPDYSSQRREQIASDARIKLLLTDSRAKLSVHEVETVCIDRLELATFASGPARTTAAQPENPACAMYAAGAHGEPVGTAFEHRSVSAFLQWAREQFSKEELQSVLFSTPLWFDSSVFELFAPLVSGGTVVIARNPSEWLLDPQAGEVTLLNATASVARQWLRSGKLPPSVQTITVAGEAQELADELYRAFPQVRRVYGFYGPAGSTVFTTWALRKPGGVRNIGRSIPGNRIYLLDIHQQPVPIGVPGEIYIGGAGLARGFVNRPELTAQRFVANPFETGGRLYKTGDFARYRSDGEIEFLGAAEDQLTIRGVRIELPEIERKLLQHSAVSESAVVPVDDPYGGKRLAAYLVLKIGQSTDAGELRQYLKKTLPEHMMPALFMCLPSLPLMPSGKVDRHALPLPVSEQTQATSTATQPRTPTEERLVEIWQEVLKTKAGLDDDFFILGGHSILALQVAARVREAFQCELPVRHLFESPTIRELARVIESKLLEEIERLTDEEAERLSSEAMVATKE